MILGSQLLMKESHSAVQAIEVITVPVEPIKTKLCLLEQEWSLPQVLESLSAPTIIPLPNTVSHLES